MYCVFCGNQIPDDSSFCAHCGRSLTFDNTIKPKSEVNSEDSFGGEYQDTYKEPYRESYRDLYKDPVQQTPKVIYSSGRSNSSGPRVFSSQSNKKYCKFCASLIDSDCIICPVCGKQIEEIRYRETSGSPVYINNTNINQVNNVGGGIRRDKWVAFLLCFFFGFFGAHRFYDKQVGMGILYLFTAGLFGFGVLFDLIRILFKPNPYYI